MCYRSKTIVVLSCTKRFGDFDKLGGGFETPRIGHSKKTTQLIELLNRKFNLSWCYSFCTAGVKNPFYYGPCLLTQEKKFRLKQWRPSSTLGKSTVRHFYSRQKSSLETFYSFVGPLECVKLGFIQKSCWFRWNWVEIKTRSFFLTRHSPSKKLPRKHQRWRILLAWLDSLRTLEFKNLFRECTLWWLL